jgi:hypothetical protein
VDIQIIWPPLKPQAGNGSAIQPVQESAIAGQLLPHVLFGLAERAAGWIEPVVSSERCVRQAVELAGGLRTAWPDVADRQGCSSSGQRSAGADRTTIGLILTVISSRLT